MNKELPSQEYLKQCFEYDFDSGFVTWKNRPIEHFKNAASCKAFNSNFSGKLAGNVRFGKSHKAIFVKICDSNFSLHRLIWVLVTGVSPKNEIDHINNDATDNRWVNLREASSSQNNFNQRRKITNSTGYKGVSFHNRDRRFYSRIKINGKRVFLGYFDNPEEAHKSYCLAALNYFGSYANFG